MARLNSSIRLRRHLRAVRVGNLYPTPLRSFSGFDQTSPISQTTILTQRRVLAASNRYSPAAAEARAPQSSGSPPQRVSRKLIGSFHNADDASEKRMNLVMSLALRLMGEPGPMTNAKMAAAARDLGVPLSTARRWVQRFRERGTLRRPSGSGGVSKHGNDFVAELMDTARELNYQGTRRQIAALMTLKGFATSASSVHRVTKREGWAHRKLRTMPMLSDAHREARYNWCLARNREAVEEEAASARGQYVVHVHVDEKWFYAQKVGGMLYMPVDAKAPVQRLFSKTQVPKVMFIAAVARPVVDKKKTSRLTGSSGFTRS